MKANTNVQIPPTLLIGINRNRQKWKYNLALCAVSVFSFFEKLWDGLSLPLQHRENEESLRVRGSSSEFRMLINVHLSLYKDSWYTLRQYEQKYCVWKGSRPSANHIGSIMWMQWKPKNGLQYLLQWRPFFVAAQKEAAKSATKLMLFFRHHPNSRKLKWDFHCICPQCWMEKKPTHIKGTNWHWPPLWNYGSVEITFSLSDDNIPSPPSSPSVSSCQVQDVGGALMENIRLATQPKCTS